MRSSNGLVLQLAVESAPTGCTTLDLPGIILSVAGFDMSEHCNTIRSSLRELQTVRRGVMIIVNKECQQSLRENQSRRNLLWQCLLKVTGAMQRRSPWWSMVMTNPWTLNMTN